MLPELLAIIAQKHIVFYEDYYSFTGVCKSWRLAAIQAAKDYKFSNGPPSWFPSLMLAQKRKDREFGELSHLSNKSIRKKSIRKIRLPQIYDKSTLVLPLVVVSWGWDRQLGFCQPGDIKWTRVKRGWGLNILDFTYYIGKVYCYVMGNIIYAWDVHRKDQTVVKISVVPKDFYYGTIAPEAYLIGMDNGERKRLLVLIREGKHVKDTFKTKIFLVFAYDLEKRTWSKVKDLGTKALFVGDASFLIDQDTTGVIKGNSIYFIDDAYFEHGLRGNGKCRDMGIYHLSDGTIDPYFNGVSLSHITPPIWL
ncbi:hypothetical protein Tco_1337546 [Tanacetum coccineum]